MQDRVSISNGNSKMGKIASVSLPAWTTCKRCGCWGKCYAKKLERIRPSVRNAYERNLSILQNAPDTYWREVEAAIMTSRFFRFHVSGDIPDKEYLNRMLDLAERNQHCQILCFTKKFELVNEVLDDGRVIPSNLHLLFSAWRDLLMDNPYNLPTAHVRYRDGYTTASDEAVECGGNCTTCALTDGGCWALKRGEQVVFNEH